MAYHGSTVRLPIPPRRRGRTMESFKERFVEEQNTVACGMRQPESRHQRTAAFCDEGRTAFGSAAGEARHLEAFDAG